jgi:hypothetical protein
MSAARKVPEERIHVVKCMHCAKLGAICTGKEGIALKELSLTAACAINL